MQEFRRWATDRADLLIARPRKVARSGASFTLSGCPITAAWFGHDWPVPLREVFDRCLALPTAARGRLALGEGRFLQLFVWVNTFSCRFLENAGQFVPSPAPETKVQRPWGFFYPVPKLRSPHA